MPPDCDPGGDLMESGLNDGGDGVSVVAPKSGRDRKIPLTTRLCAALKAHRHLRR